MKTKTCTSCERELPLSEFNKRADAPTGLAYCCRDCLKQIRKEQYSRNKDLRNRQCRDWYNQNAEKVRRRTVERLYGITYDQYLKMLEDQKGGCAICQVPLKAHFGLESEYEVAKIDHCHTTGKVRGLLCKRCNVSLGNFNDDPLVLSRAIDYLNNAAAPSCAGAAKAE